MSASPIPLIVDRAVDAVAILGALPDPIVLMDANGRMLYANPAAEQFFETSASLLCRQRLHDLAPFGSPILDLVGRVQDDGHGRSEYGVGFGTPRIGFRNVDIHASPLPEAPGCVVIRLETRTMAEKIDRQLTHRNAARSVSGMAAMMAHEIKNPLSGIRGAAQLLEQGAAPADKDLSRLICDEADRIRALVDRMEVFADARPLDRGPVNIHQVLDHVARLAQAGFAAHHRFVNRYDPSLPPVLGHRDSLVQVFLNLVKNAAEAAPDVGGEIVLTSAYRHGLRLGGRGGQERLELPIEVGVQDNGPGVAEEIKPHLFDAFVSTKRGGSGLGLALVAKIIGDHGGVIECDSRPGRTLFNVRLPVHQAGMEEAP
jgi:two-component system, NtrC family, nitrogen regulation sensor histidine kinase GlnL